ACEFGEELRAGAERLIVVSEVGLRADEADCEATLRLTEALEDAGIEHRRLEARVGTDQENGVGPLDAFDGRVEQIGSAAERRIELCPVLPAIDIGRAKLPGENLQREHLFRCG